MYKGTWTEAPEPVSPEQVTEEQTEDLVVCGAGISGAACALRAAQRGASVIVVEKSASWSARGGNIGVPNSSFMKAQGYENDIAEIAREWIKRCGNRCDEEILWRYLHHGARAMDWLLEIVTRPEYGCRPALQGCLYCGDPYWEIVGSHRLFDGPMAKKGLRPGASDAVYALITEALKCGVRFLYRTPAVQLQKEGGRVTGVYAKKENAEMLLVKARTGVVLATGDIGGNEEMCEDLAPVANKVKKIYHPKGGNEGDGHRMGYWAGGTFEDTPFPAVLHPQAFHFSNFCFLHVTPEGKRYYNEDNFVQGKSLAILRQGFSYAWAICDSGWPAKVVRSLEYGGGIFWGHDCELGEIPFDAELEKERFAQGLRNGLVVTADSPTNLAEKMGVPIDTFAETFRRYREITCAGKDTDFGKKPELLFPLDKPPYYAMKFGPALLAVVGGLRVDTSMNVLDEARRPVEGLYAVGNTAGGRYGVDYPILIPGNSHGTALTFGFLTGEELGGRTDE